MLLSPGTLPGISHSNWFLTVIFVFSYKSLELARVVSVVSKKTLFKVSSDSG